MDSGNQEPPELMSHLGDQNTRLSGHYPLHNLLSLGILIGHKSVRSGFLGQKCERSDKKIALEESRIFS